MHDVPFVEDGITYDPNPYAKVSAVQLIAAIKDQIGGKVVKEPEELERRAQVTDLEDEKAFTPTEWRLYVLLTSHYPGVVMKPELLAAVSKTATISSVWVHKRRLIVKLCKMGKGTVKAALGGYRYFTHEECEQYNLYDGILSDKDANE